jgi:hypothetical protein
LKEKFFKDLPDRSMGIGQAADFAGKTLKNGAAA